MLLNRGTAIALAITLVLVFGLAGWGKQLGLDSESLAAVRTGAASLGAVLLAVLGAILKKVPEGDK